MFECISSFIGIHESDGSRCHGHLEWSLEQFTLGGATGANWDIYSEVVSLVSRELQQIQRLLV